MDLFEKYNVGKLDDFNEHYNMPHFTCPVCNTKVSVIIYNYFELKHNTTCELNYYFNRLSYSNTFKFTNVENMLEEIDANYQTELKKAILIKL